MRREMKKYWQTISPEDMFEVILEEALNDGDSIFPEISSLSATTTPIACLDQTEALMLAFQHQNRNLVARADAVTLEEIDETLRDPQTPVAETIVETTTPVREESDETIGELMQLLGNDNAFRADYLNRKHPNTMHAVTRWMLCPEEVHEAPMEVEKAPTGLAAQVDQLRVEVRPSSFAWRVVQQPQSFWELGLRAAQRARLDAQAMR